MLHSINRPSFTAWLSLLLEILVSMRLPVVCWPGCDVIDFEIDLIFLIKSFFYMTRNSRQKFNILRTIKAFQGNKKYFSSFLKGFYLPKIVSDLRVPESASLSSGESFLRIFSNWKKYVSLSTWIEWMALISFCCYFYPHKIRWEVIWYSLTTNYTQKHADEVTKFVM